MAAQINTNNKTQALVDLEEKWTRVDMVWGGTDTVRANNILFRNTLESQEDYEDRKKRSTLNAAFKRTVKKSVGKAFASEMEVNVPSQLEYLLLNCDRSGTSLQTFAKDALEEAIKYGVYYILVDSPDTPVQSAYEQELFNVRPYFIGIKPLNVITIDTDIINNELVLTQFMYQYMVDDNVFYADYRLGDGVVEVTIYDDEEVVTNEYTLSLLRIPLVPIYGDKIAPFIGQPVLDEMIHLVLKHYWKQSELDWNEHYGLTPILQIAGAESRADAATGESSMDHFKLGASTTVVTANQGDVRWTTSDSAGIKAAQDSLDRLLKEIDEAGLELTVRKEVAETATGRRLDASEANSILKSIAVDLEWSLYDAIVIAGEYLNVDASGTEVNLDTTYTVDTVSDIELLFKLFQAGILTLEETRTEIKARRIIISESVNESLEVPVPANQSNLQ